MPNEAVIIAKINVLFAFSKNGSLSRPERKTANLSLNATAYYV